MKTQTRFLEKKISEVINAQFRKPLARLILRTFVARLNRQGLSCAEEVNQSDAVPNSEREREMQDNRGGQVFIVENIR